MADIRKPAYQGRPEPLKIAKRFINIIIILLVLGFIRAGIDNNWFNPIIEFILS